MSIGVSELSAADVAAVVGNNNGRNNDGMFGNDWAWIVILLLFGWGRGGFGGFGGGYSYARGLGRYAKRDSMGRYSRDDGYMHRDVGYSREDGKEYMMERLGELMDEAQKPSEKEALRRCMEALKRA